MNAKLSMNRILFSVFKSADFIQLRVKNKKDVLF